MATGDTKAMPVLADSTFCIVGRISNIMIFLRPTPPTTLVKPRVRLVSQASSHKLDVAFDITVI